MAARCTRGARRAAPLDRPRSVAARLGRLCGSEGTIGFITSAVLRIHAKPEARLVAAYTLPSLDAAVSAVYLALREEAAPSGIRIHDAAEAATHFAGLSLPTNHVPHVRRHCGPDRSRGVRSRSDHERRGIAEGGATTSTALAEQWWRRLHVRRADALGSRRRCR